MNYEKTGFVASLTGGILLAVCAVVVAVLSKSQAIFFDGVYSFITAIMAFISLIILKLLKTPETKRRPYGFSAFEPFLNLTKSLIILVMTIVALYTNILVLIAGGRNIELGLAAVFSIICIFIYLTVIILIRICLKNSDSDILRLEEKSWRIDTALTFGVAVSLMVAFFLKETRVDFLLPYLDPALVILIFTISLPVPINEGRKALAGLLLISSDNMIEKQVLDSAGSVIEKYSLHNTHVYALKVGRKYQIYVYTQINNTNLSVAYLDDIREKMKQTIENKISIFYMDVIFTNNP
jgi:predicted Co/Zn/Cd cation transporter (cation efflux family)